jgi:hypothetical protein
MLLGALVVASVAFALPAGAHRADLFKSKSKVYWTWDNHKTVGNSKLTRTESGLYAEFKSSKLRPGDVVTFWYIVANYPEHCAVPYECVPPGDLFATDDEGNPTVKGDF